MAEQLQLRRGTATQVASFTGAQGECVVDTTNNRIVVNDGSTEGGWPLDLSVRTAVSNANYSALVTDRIIAYTAIAAARTVSLPAASAYPTGTVLWIVDENGSVSTTCTITASPNGSDTIEGAANASVNGPYGALGLEGNGSNGWTIVSIRTHANSRTAVSDANYSALVTDRAIAYTAITAARTVTLPAAAAFPVGVGGIPARLVIVDESGSCSATDTITIARAGSDTINGGTSLVLSSAYASLTIEGNGSNAWTIIAQMGTIAQAPNGANMQFAVLETLVSGMSGASVNASLQIPANCIVFAVGARVVTTITGAASYEVGVSGNSSQFGSALSLTAGSTNYGLIGPTAFYSATTLMLTSSGGSFTAGAVRLSIHLAYCSASTS